MTSLLLSQATAEGFQGRFTGAIGPPFWKGATGGVAVQINDQPTPLGAHGRYEGKANLKNTGEIQLQQPLPLLQTCGC
jgi:hypothetical protein